MRKRILLLLLGFSVLAAGCTPIEQPSAPDSAVEETTQPTGADAVVDCTLIKGSPVDWEQKKTEAVMEPEESAWQKLNVPEDRTLWEMAEVNKKIVLGLLVEPDNAGAQMSTEMEIGILDPATGTYTSAGTTPHQYSGMSLAASDQFYAMVKSSYDEEGTLYGDLTLLDVRDGTMETVDRFPMPAPHDGVHLTSVGGKGVAHWYTDGATGETVVHYYDFVKKTTSELLRQKDDPASDLSVAAICSDGTDIALLWQTDESSRARESVTQLCWMDTAGAPLRTEILPLESYLNKSAVTIEKFAMCGNYYYFKTKHSTQHVFLAKDGTSFTTIPVDDLEPLSLCSISENGCISFSAFSKESNKLYYKQITADKKSYTHFMLTIAQENNNYTEIFTDDTLFVVRSLAGSLSSEGTSYYYKDLDAFRAQSE